MFAERPIVVGVANGQHAALSYGVSRAEQRGCELRVVHAYYVPRSTIDAVYAHDVAAGFEAAGHEVLDEARRFVESLNSSATVHFILTRGHASPVLLEESVRAAELVLGPDNASWVSRLFEGQVSQFVVTGSGCPVVVVPEGWTTSESRHGIILTIGDEPPAEGPLSYALESASSLKEPLQLIHVAPEGTTELENDVMRVNVSRLLEGWQHRYPRVKVETIL